ncbi:hypothetical protein AVEN_6596-1 [Araneus ventricosus]|uniref:Uncharacterized protein n=1 Tax=Araneus ventricosus TaxID=182803 RepID=A0A4Y2LLK0_ARAVE|nr:hypothetical protein AVEN_6596-1 [Araneus ventricosus]
MLRCAFSLSHCLARHLSYVVLVMQVISNTSDGIRTSLFRNWKHFSDAFSSTEIFSSRNIEKTSSIVMKLKPVENPSNLEAGHPIHSEDFLAPRFHFPDIIVVGHSSWSDCANQTYWQPDTLGYCVSSSPDPDFLRLNPTHTPPFCGFRFCERGSVFLTNYCISVLWLSGPNENPNRMELKLFAQSTPFLIGFLH